MHESCPVTWVANIERVEQDTSADIQAKGRALENHEAKKEEKRPGDKVDTNKTAPKSNNPYSFSLSRKERIFTSVCGTHLVSTFPPFQLCSDHQEESIVLCCVALFYTVTNKPA